jgi:hypothetical protein
MPYKVITNGREIDVNERLLVKAQSLTSNTIHGKIACVPKHPALQINQSVVIKKKDALAPSTARVEQLCVVIS